MRQIERTGFISDELKLDINWASIFTNQSIYDGTDPFRLITIEQRNMVPRDSILNNSANGRLDFAKALAVK